MGDEANLDTLRQFSNKPPQRLAGYDFEELFVWLSASLGKVALSTPGESGAESITESPGRMPAPPQSYRPVS